MSERRTCVIFVKILRTPTTQTHIHTGTLLEAVTLREVIPPQTTRRTPVKVPVRYVVTEGRWYASSKSFVYPGVSDHAANGMKRSSKNKGFRHRKFEEHLKFILNPTRERHEVV